MHDLLNQPPSREALDAIFAAFDTDPDSARPLHAAALEALRGWPREEPWVVCALHALEHWSVEALRVAEVEELYPLLQPKLRGTPEPFAPLAFELELRLLFYTLGSPWVEANLKLPPALLTWLRLAEGQRWQEGDSPYSLKWYGHVSILANTRYDCDSFSDDRNRDPAEGPAAPKEPDELHAVYAALREITPRSEMVRGTGAWLSVGDWSDKHITCLCVHQPGVWEEVSDWHDGHPWLNGHDWGDEEADSVVGYLRQLAGV